MRLTTDRTLALAMIALVALIGCDNKPASIGTGVAGGSTGGVADAGPDARNAADTFLVALRDRTATPDNLTPALRAAIAPPTSDEDKKLGYSAPNAQEWLAQFRDTNFRVLEEAKFGHAIVLRGRAESPGKKDAFSLRMVRDGNTYKADWLQRSNYLSMNIASPTDPNLAAAQDTVRNMLDLLIGDNQKLAHALMSPKWKKRLSPLPPEVQPKGGIDYEPGFISTALRAWVFGATSYAITDAKPTETSGSIRFAVELQVEDKRAPHTIKVKKDEATGWWLLEGFDL